jgi:hypothetical protein
MKYLLLVTPVQSNSEKYHEATVGYSENKPVSRREGSKNT